MSIFKKRLMRPNQLATLRELESKVSVGKVLWAADNLAVLTGLNPDAPLGTKLSFVSGGTGVLLWHRSDHLSFALVLGGAASIQAGEGVECKIKGVLQVIDDARGPITRKDYELWQAPAGESLFGCVVDYLGNDWGSAGGAAPTASGDEVDSAAAGAKLCGHMERVKPLINQQVAMKNREQICESLHTGVTALDVLTPLGRGASLLVVGPTGTGKSSLAVDAVVGQAGSGVRCVLASTTRTPTQVDALRQALAAAGALSHTTVVAAPPSAPLGERYAALCAAAALGERVRDEGGHALVVLDDLAPLVGVWEALVTALAELGPDMIRQGLIKDQEGRDAAVGTPANEEALVEYQGMLVSGAVAQRRGFYSTLFMRAAKMASAFGGGSMTLLPLVAGRPATGTKKQVDLPQYQTLTDAQKAKLVAALEARRKLVEVVEEAGKGELSTETVEEFISISDGQVVLEARAGAHEGYRVNPRLSLTRIGMRAYDPALETLAAQVRLDLAQADDARRFATARDDPALVRLQAYTARLAAALAQPEGRPAPLEAQVVALYAIQRGYCDAVAPDAVPEFLERALGEVARSAPGALSELRATRRLTAGAERGIARALGEVAAAYVPGGVAA